MSSHPVPYCSPAVRAVVDEVPSESSSDKGELALVEGFDRPREVLGVWRVRRRIS